MARRLFAVAIIWTDAGLYSMGQLGTYITEIWTKA